MRTVGLRRSEKSYNGLNVTLLNMPSVPMLSQFSRDTSLKFRIIREIHSWVENDGVSTRSVT